MNFVDRGIMINERKARRMVEIWTLWSISYENGMVRITLLLSKNWTLYFWIWKLTPVLPADWNIIKYSNSSKCLKLKYGISIFKGSGSIQILECLLSIVSIEMRTLLVSRFLKQWTSTHGKLDTSKFCICTFFQYSYW